MADALQWTAWREEYIAGLRKIVDFVPFDAIEQHAKLASYSFDVSLLRSLLERLVSEGYVNRDDSSYFMKAFFYLASAFDDAMMEDREYTSDELEAFLESAKGVELDPEDIAIDDASDLLRYAMTLMYLPLCRAIYYILSNNLFAFKTAYSCMCEALELNVNWGYCRMRQQQLFEFLCSLTPFGVDKLFADFGCPLQYEDGLFSAIREGDYKAFNEICHEGNINFTEVSEIAGLLHNKFGALLDTFDASFECDENDEEAIKIDAEARDRSMFTMMGVSYDYDEYKKGVSVEKDIFADRLPFIQTDEQASLVFNCAIQVFGLLPYFDYLDQDELSVIDRLLYQPSFDVLLELAVLCYCKYFKQFPAKVHYPFTSERQAEIEALYIDSPEAQCQEDDVFKLPDNYFSIPKDRRNKAEYFECENDVEDGGPSQLSNLINWLGSEGYIEADDRTKRRLAYVLTGHDRPDDFDPEEKFIWKEDKGNELCYLIKTIIVSDQGKKFSKYGKMCAMFVGPQWKTPVKDLANNATPKFMKRLRKFYPTLGSVSQTTIGAIERH